MLVRETAEVHLYARIETPNGFKLGWYRGEAGVPRKTNQAFTPKSPISTTGSEMLLISTSKNACGLCIRARLTIL